MKVSKFQFIFVALVAVLFVSVPLDAATYHCAHKEGYRGSKGSKPCIKPTDKATCEDTAYTAADDSSQKCVWTNRADKHLS